MATALVNIPETAARGEVVEIKVLISHPMETGFRPGMDGRLIPRDIIRSLRCDYDGVTVFEAELHPAIAANPFFVFHLRADVSGEIVLVWTDEQGNLGRQTGQITVG
jgi:sulfur-oxidizing protein SoxZ